MILPGFHEVRKLVTQVDNHMTLWNVAEFIMDSSIVRLLLGAPYKENTLFCCEVVYGYDYDIMRYH